MRPLLGWTALALLALGLLAALANPAPADPLVSTIGDSGLGSFTGTFDYAAKDDTNATLLVTLKNTSPAKNGGFLTAFAFNNPGGRITKVGLSSSDKDFGLIGGPAWNDLILAGNAGRYDIGASLSKMFLGGGNPKAGLGVGQDATFAFTFGGTKLDEIDNTTFFATYAPKKNGEEGPPFLARFRGFEDEGSDKVPGQLGGPPGGIVPSEIPTTPEPGTLVLVGTGALGMAVGWLARRRSRLV